MKQIIFPRECYYGENSLQQLKNLKGRCRAAFIVTDKNIVKLGLTKMVTDILDEIGVKWDIFDQVMPNPTRSICRIAYRQAVESGLNPDWFIGLGGGSSMDCAKVVRIFTEYPDITYEELIPPSVVPPLGKCKYCAITTTAGTGSEVSFGAVVSDDTIEPHVKSSIVTLDQVPDMSITDPAFLRGVPPKITASTGFDALVHAIESYSGKGATEFSASVSLLACKMIYDNLPAAYHHPDDMAAKEAVSAAQMFAGAAFTLAGLGIAHTCGHQLSAYYDAPHGLSCGLMMPYAARFSETVCAKKYADIARVWGLEFQDDQEGSEKFIQAMLGIVKECNLPLTIADMGIDEATFLKDVDNMARFAMGDIPLNQLTPRTPTHEEYVKVYKNAFYGNLDPWVD